MERRLDLWSSNPGEAFHAAAYRKAVEKHPTVHVPKEQVTDAPDLDTAVSLSAAHDEVESEAFWNRVYRPAGRLVSAWSNEPLTR